VLLALLFLANRAGVRAPAVYAVLGVVVWFLFLKSGVHATVAGVLVAMTVPARTRIDREAFLALARGQVDAFATADAAARPGFAGPGQLDALSALEHACERAGTPLQRLEHALHPWVSFVIMPVFALANAGVRVVGEGQPLGNPAVILGIVLGLVVGKPLGISLASWLAVRLGLAERPPDTTWSELVGVACLGGIGFTMALFIAALAFDGTTLLSSAKIGVLAASVLAALLGWAALTAAARRRG
jgi:NhaA family Na+:H+ antiporter